MKIIDIAFNIAFNVSLIGMVGMVTVLPYLVRKKGNKILVDYLKNEKIVHLLENSKYSDFVVNYNGTERLNNSNYVRLLNEYVSDSKLFKTYGLRVLKIYYSTAAFNTNEESYKIFKQNMENKK